MTAPTFFRELRKTTVFFLLLFLAFLVHRILDLFGASSDSTDSFVKVDQLRKAESVVCHNIVGGAAFGIDSVFDEHTRVYFYSKLASDSILDLEHRWFCGIDTMLIVPCTCNGNICMSSIAPERLKAGEWSVDLVRGRQIFDSRQFLVVEPNH